ncbi:MAG: polymerase, sigma subunit, SigV [Firmicutes bacterium]|nr:polymerase, sigma subunit, SigV [Bacillota bacterium]
MNEAINNKLVEHILQNQNKFYRIAYCYVYQKDAALDIVQNAICRALENHSSLRNTNAIKTWFYRILINECLQYRNKGKREIICEPAELREDVYYEDAYEAKVEIYQKVCELPEHLKTVVILHYFEQLTLKEISQSTGVNLSTVKTRLYAALKRLKKDLEAENE